MGSNKVWVEKNYTVQSGDSFLSIGKELLGHSYHGLHIKEANPHIDELHPGDMLRIPSRDDVVADVRELFPHKDKYFDQAIADLYPFHNWSVRNATRPNAFLLPDPECEYCGQTEVSKYGACVGCGFIGDTDGK